MSKAQESSSRMSNIARGLVHRPRTVVASLLVVALVSAWLASRLELRSDFSELLPTSDLAVQALERTRGRVGDMSLLLLGTPPYR